MKELALRTGDIVDEDGRLIGIQLHQQRDPYRDMDVITFEMARELELLGKHLIWNVQTMCWYLPMQSLHLNGFMHLREIMKDKPSP